MAACTRESARRRFSMVVVAGQLEQHYAAAMAMGPVVSRPEKGQMPQAALVADAVLALRARSWDAERSVTGPTREPARRTAARQVSRRPRVRRPSRPAPPTRPEVTAVPEWAVPPMMVVGASTAPAITRFLVSQMR
jgi:hypothetical protein